jgi:polyisoprenoid-binding protein YceI
VPVEGRFKRFGATIAFDPKRPETAEVAFAIDTASASFGAPELDLEVPKPTWLAAARFPQATFRSTVVKPTGAGKFAVAGTLSIKGVSRQVVVPVALARSGATTTATGSFTIKRLDYRVGEGDWSDTSLLADEVEVRFKLLLGGVPPP